MNSAPPGCEQRENVKIEIAHLQPVTARPCSALTLIIDHDLGFVMWLGEVFNELGCQAVPALHCRQGLALAKRLELPITTLLVNPELPGATRTVKALAAANPGMRIILIRDSAAQPVPCNADNRIHVIADHGVAKQANPKGIQTRLTLERPSPWEPISRTEWVARVGQLLAKSPAQ
jgi:hypothetical protein